MGETDEFVPRSSHVEDDTAQDSAVEESVVPMIEQPAELPTEETVASEDVQPETAAETDELDAISQTLSDEAVSHDIVEDAVGAVADSDPDAVAVADPDAVADDDTATAEVTEADSFDDIVAPVPAAAAVTHVPEQSAAAGQVPWWPFMVYLGAWVVLAAAAVWQLLQLPADQVVYESPTYVMTILGGLIMTATGPLLILAVWLATRANRSPQERHGLLTSALMKGALVTLIGAIIWWASLVIIDYLRLGRLL